MTCCSPSSREPAALLLDLDGTLVDSEPVHRAATARSSRPEGGRPDLSLFTGRRAEDVFAPSPAPGPGTTSTRSPPR